MLKGLLNKYWPFIVIFLVAILLYHPLFSLYFFQDDFFHFKMAEVNSVTDFLNFFSFNNHFGYVFYRPLTTQVYLFSSKTIFGFQPVYYHLIAFAIFLANTVLVYKISLFLLKKTNLAFFVSLFYTISSSNIGTLSYLSAFEEIGMAFFFFITLLFYLQQKRHAWIFLIFALMSRENAVVIPIILFLYELLLGQKNWKRIIPYFLIVILYGILRVLIGIPDASVYKPIFDFKKILNGYFWYFAWGFGWPEMLIDFIGPGLKINSNLFQQYGYHVVPIFINSSITIIIYFFGIVRSLTKDKKQLLFFWGIFVVGLLPVIFWPWHRFTYYLTIPLLGLLGSYIFCLSKLTKILFIIGGISLLLTYLITINLSYKTYWAINRAKISENFVKLFKQQFPSLPTGASICITNDPNYKSNFAFGNSSTQTNYALSGENGLQVLYQDYSLKVYYEDKDQCESSPSGMLKLQYGN